MFNRQNQQGGQFKRKGQRFSQNIRRQNRDEIFNKRRYQGTENFNNQSNDGSYKIKTLIIDENLKKQILEFINLNYTDSMLPQLIRLAFSVDVLEKHKGIIGIRKIISTQVQAPLQQVIDNGIVNECINLVKQNNFLQLKLQGTWILTNIASGTAQQTKMLVQKGVIELMVQLLHENQFGIIDQAVWALGNIAADSIKYRDKIISLGAVQPLINIVENSSNRNLIRNGTWTITNLVRGYPSPKYQSIKGTLPLIAKVLKSQQITDKQVISDCIWALSYLTEGAKSRVQRLLETGILPLIFKFVKDSYSGISLPSLRIIGNFSTGNQLQTQQLIDNGFFDLSYVLLDFSKRGIRRQTSWILSNIAAGTSSQVDAFLSQQKLLQKLLDKFLVDLAEVKRQICWIFSNFGHLGNPRKIIELYMNIDIIRYFENILIEEDQKTIQNVLQCLYKVIGVGEKAKLNSENLILKRLYTSSIVSSLQRLQEHKSSKIYKLVAKIINKYFQVENPLI